MDELIQYYQTLLQYAQDNASRLNPESQRALADFIAQLTETISLQMNIPPPMEQIEQEEEQVVEDLTGGVPPEMPTPRGPTPPIEPAPHESSNISGFNYNPETEELYVQFLGKYPNRQGAVYGYQGVPPYIFDIFRRGAIAPKTSGRNAWHRWKKDVAPSHGASMWALIRAGGFPYQKLS